MAGLLTAMETESRVSMGFHDPLALSVSVEVASAPEPTGSTLEPVEAVSGMKYWKMTEAEFVAAGKIDYKI